MLAQLGYEKLDDVIGHTDLLRPRDISLLKTQHIDLSYILSVRIQKFSFPLDDYAIDLFCVYHDTILFSISRTLVYQSGAALLLGIRRFTVMVQFWMMFCCQIQR